jgi:hypothetical protein
VFLIVSDGVVGEDGALAVLIEAAQGVPDVVGKEPLSVENDREHLGEGSGGHGLVMGVLIELFFGSQFYSMFNLCTGLYRLFVESVPRVAVPDGR